MFLNGDRDFFPITRLICDKRTQLWMVDRGEISVNEKVGDDVGVACYIGPPRVKIEMNWLVGMAFH